MRQKGNFLLARLFKVNKNVFWLIVLSGVTAISQFVVYKFIDNKLGKESLGVWSLVVAVSSLGQISSFGFSSSLVRYLPEMLKKKQDDEINKILGTINLSNFFLTLPILLILYFPALFYADHLLNPKQFLVFSSVIPLTMIGLFANNLFSVYSYLFDAMQKYYLRSFVQIAGWLLFLILSVVLMPIYGLLAIGISFMIQNVFLFALAIIIVQQKKMLSYSYPVCFHKESFKKVFSFGLKSQYINLLVLFFDPLIKFFITKYVGLSGTANYEFSNKIVLQVRNILVSTNQIIVPQMVLNRSQGTENIYFRKISDKNIFLSSLLGMLMLIAAPVIVILFSNHYDSFLMQCIIILNIGWVCNMVTSTHYYSCMGLDKMNALVVYHLLLCLVVFISYVTLGNYIKADIISFLVPTIALFLGSIYLSYSLSAKINTAFSWIRSGAFIYFIFASIILFTLQFMEIGSMIHLVMPLLFIPYIYWTIRKYRSGKLLNSNLTDVTQKNH